ncbi:MAG: hypothetical protein CMJ62_11070 [Planctomycetaceae bacterium]|jgi:hypothetical protein|nr:hypothetical protein [Planctomycetaceae bacterium]
MAKKEESSSQNDLGGEAPAGGAGGEAPAGGAGGEAPAGGGGQPRQQQIQVDESKAITSYANFCRVTGTPEELIVDFALNQQSTGIPTKPIEINQRIVVNFYTAKRLLAALQLSLHRHEATFGVLETDIQKRVRPSAQRPNT